MKATHLTKNRSKRAVPRVSLFPFLAVLICTMGALVLLLFAVMRQARLYAAQVAVAKASELRSGAELRNGSGAKSTEPGNADSADREMVQWRIDQLKDSRKTTESQMADLRLYLGHLEDNARQLREQLAKLQAEHQQLAEKGQANGQRLAGSKQELDDLRRQVADAERRLAAAREAVGKQPRSYAVVPYAGSNGTHRRPIYLECRADAVVLQPDGVRFMDTDFDGPMGPNNPLAAVLRAAREYLLSRAGFDPQRDGEPYPLLLVRPSGIVAYYAALEAIHGWGADFGYELVGDDWQLSFQPSDPVFKQTLLKALEIARVEQQRLIAAAPSKYGPASRSSYRAAPGGGIERDGGGPPGDGAPLGRGGPGPRSGNSYRPGMPGSTGMPGSPGGFGSGPGGPWGDGLASATGGNRPSGFGNGQSRAGNSTESALPYPDVDAAPGMASASGVPSPGGAPSRGVASNAGVAPAGGPNVGGMPNAASGVGGTGVPGGVASGSPNGVQSGLPGGSSAGTPSGQPAGTGCGSPGGTCAAKPGGTGESGPPPAGQQNVSAAVTPPWVRPGQQNTQAPPAGEQAKLPEGAEPAGPPRPGEWHPTMPAPPPVKPKKDDPDPKHKKRDNPVVDKSGQDWALRNAARGAVAITRSLRVECYADRLVLPAERAGGQAIVVPFEGPTNRSTDRFVSAVWDRMDTWGIAGKNMYWRPSLDFSVAPGGEQRYEELTSLLEGSGLAARRKQ